MGRFSTEYRRRGPASGFSLVELLVVMGIIATVFALAVPVVVRNGLFSGRKSNIGARELFETMRAARTYAATHSVETAVVYSGRQVTDSETGLDVPIVDRVGIVRRLQRREIDEIRALEALFIPNFPDFEVSDTVYVPLDFEIVRDGAGVFQGFAGDMRLKTLPNQTCILSDLFEVDPDPSVPPLAIASRKALTPIHVWNPSAGLTATPPTTFFYEPVAGNDYAWAKLGTTNYPNAEAFPAHVFLTSGEVETNAPYQRVTFSVGMLPSIPPDDRFYKDPTDPSVTTEQLNVTYIGTEALPLDVYRDNDYASTVYIDMDTDVQLFITTGRVKVSS